MSLSTTAAANPQAAQPQPARIARWLLVVAFMVFAMVVVGGITRLTESGLSMVRWEPISGVVPPLDEAQWHAEFDAYKATPEYQKINHGMSLGEFKAIFFWEYLHRVLGRLIGMAFALPLAWFAWKRAIPRGYGPRLVALLALGGLQGAIGWWMVASGLVDRPDVSHIRLAVHLLTALFILGGLVWTALDLIDLSRSPAARPAKLTGIAAIAMIVLFVQLLLGAFTAGLDAGYAFAEWPTMGGQIFPAGVAFIEPAWRNLVDNPIVVQFVHRWLAWVAAALLLALAWRAHKMGVKGPVHAIATFLVLQIGLGIATLLTGVDIHVAVAHQAVGALLVASVAWTAHRVGARRG
ncbi:cytochrome c oxidase assembly protein subunit 15 [Sphingomonas laterariae]|uniref:Heme A synthase n=1 Tax=Edaphosphingomonas laterariae TaxID=861865 RepID=A0A239E0Z1_9SPHN|nr:COX15/CtaA family protein [Sphingomonas laterariae]SNS38356.1 cytochrome c oxidase assembly protein subunit 15 [Sphingomonas laterariae]